MKRFLILSLLFSCFAEAKVLTKYEAYVSAKTRDVGGVSGEWIDILGSLGGWSCLATTSMKLTEMVPGPNGKNIPKVFASRGDYSRNTAWMGQPAIRTQFFVNFENLDPKMSIEVNEHCSKAVYTTCTDSKGNTSGCTEMKTLDFYWDCDLKKGMFPQASSPTASYVCQPRNSTFAALSNAMAGSLFNAFKEKDIVVSLKYLGTQKSLKDYNCRGNFNNAKTLKFTQGVPAGRGEDDFYFYLRINDGPIFTRRSTDGIINFDLAYCPRSDERSLKIDMSAVEKDLIFDDLYQETRAGFLNLDGNQRTTTVQMIRKVLIGSDRAGAVGVELIDERPSKTQGW